MLPQILDLPFTWFQYSIDSKPRCNRFGLQTHAQIECTIFLNNVKS